MSRALDDVSLLQGIRYLARVGEILRHPFQAAGDPDFLSLVPVGHELSHLADGAHLVLDLVRKVPQFPISVPFAVDGYQHRDGVAEIGIDHRPHDAGGEFGALRPRSSRGAASPRTRFTSLRRAGMDLSSR